MKSKKTTKYLLIGFGLFLIIVILGSKMGWFGKGEIIKLATEKPEKRTIIETITANGKVQPETEVKISSDVSGEIVDLYIKEGQQVQQGDLLLKIKPDIYLSSLARVEASVNTAKANLANSKARLTQVTAQFHQTELTFKRNQKLWEQKTISQSDYEQSQSALQQSQAEVDAAKENVNSSLFSVKSAEASLKEANENLNKTSIYAPMSGTVSKLSVEKGERVVGTIQMTGTELLRIANLNKMEITVDVNENDIVRAKLSDTAVIEVDAYLNQKFKGVVTEIANSANLSGAAALSSDQVTNYQVKVLILNESYKHLNPSGTKDFYPFRPGMSATVEIHTKSRSGVLSVPIQAVTARTDTAKANKQKETKKTEDEQDSKSKKRESSTYELVYVYNPKSKTVDEHRVKTGIQDSDYIEIISGLNESDEVVVSPYSAISKKLKDKMKVEKVDKEKLYEEAGKDKK